MAIVITLDRMLQERGMTLSELAGRIDITLANLSILKTGKARVIATSAPSPPGRGWFCPPLPSLLPPTPGGTKRPRPLPA